MSRPKNRLFTEKPSRIFGVALPIILLGYALDRLVKYLTVQKIKPAGGAELIPGVLRLTYAENTGAAFGMFAGGRWVFVAVTFVVVAVITSLMLRGFFKNTAGFVAVSFVMSGIFGNLIDRMRQGFVVDMFETVFMDFAIFNVADVFLTVGGLVLIAVLLFSKEHRHDTLSKKNGENGEASS